MELIAEAVELARNATCPGDYDQAWELVEKAAADRDTAGEKGLAMLESLDPVERKIGCDLLGCLAEFHESLRETVLFAVLDLAGSEGDRAVHASIARALGATADDRATPELLRLAGHPDEDVREYVAWALPMDPAASDAVVEVLIRLSADAADEVRNWATFALGSRCQVDGKAIREALWARVDDDFGEVGEEAVTGLARRRDRRIVPYAARLLDEAGATDHMLTAIACLGDPALVPYLEEYDAEVVAEALRECDPQARAARDAFAAGLTEALHARLPGLGFGMCGDLYEPGITLVLDEGRHWPLEPLLDRAGGDASRAAELIAGALAKDASAQEPRR